MKEETDQSPPADFQEMLEEQVRDLGQHVGTQTELEINDTDTLSQSQDHQQQSTGPDHALDDVNMDNENLNNGIQNSAILPSRECISLCGRILRIMGDEQTCKACGKHLRSMGDEIYINYAARRLLSPLLNALANEEGLQNGDMAYM